MNSIEATSVRPGHDILDEVGSLLSVSVPDDWSDLDTRAVDTARVLAADAVQSCGNGHPGTAMSLAPAAYATVPAGPCATTRTTRHWPGRDRFILSVRPHQPHPVHPALPSGVRDQLEDLKQFRDPGVR